MKTLVIYHAIDFDGKGSAAIVDQHHQDGVDFLPMNYNWNFDPRKIAGYEKIFIVDFTLEKEKDWVECIDEVGFENVIWIDHHKSNMKEMTDLMPELENLQGIRRDGTAAIALTFEWFNRRKPTEGDDPLIYFLAQYDVFNQDNKSEWLNWTLPVQYGMRSKEWHPKNDRDEWQYALLHQGDIVDDVLPYGRQILEFQEESFKFDMYRTIEIDDFLGYKALAVNSSFGTSLLYGNKLDEYPICISFSMTKKGWKVRAFSERDDIDLGELFKEHFGGGGHKGIGAVTLENSKFEEVIMQHLKRFEVDGNLVSKKVLGESTYVGDYYQS